MEKMTEPLVSAATGVMTSLLTKLSALIEEEYELLGGMQRDITFLSTELSSMNALLQKLAASEEKLDAQGKVWRDNIRELSYDIEDCIDIFTHKLDRGDAKPGFISKVADKIRKLWSRYQMANQIQELKARVVEESERHFRYKYSAESCAEPRQVEIDPRLPALYVEAERLVGIQGPVKKVMNWLTKHDSSSTQLKLVSVVGFGGFGKTTLANQVYHEIKGQFDCTAFVPVSRNPVLKKVLRDLLKELGSDADASCDERQIINELRIFLQDKRYLIIVDDVWSTIAWEFVKSALPENNLRSRIITTTRHSDVAESCCSCIEGYIHYMQPLSYQDSQKLFYKRIFQNQSPCPPHLEEVSMDIIQKCQGMPLAINTVASLLANKPVERGQWEQIRDSMTSGLHSQLVRDILLLSYYDLPYHLKSCFLYLCIFPEDCKIRREKLIWRWIAEGFITDVMGQTLEEVGDNYFNELINRSLIQPIDIMYDGTAKACRVHDMVLDLIISLCTEQNFITIVEGQVYKPAANKKIRRLSLLSNTLGNDVLQEIMNKCSQIRSLIRFRVVDKEAFHLPVFHCLRVLVLRCRCRDLGNRHVRYIGSCFQLKYLEIGCQSITELPDEIGALRLLQTLDIRDSHIQKLPRAIGRLQNLVRLLVDSNVELPDEIGHLKALQTLSHAWPYNSLKFVRQLGQLTNLRVLAIGLHELGDHSIGKYQEGLELLIPVLGKHGLQSLEIDSYDYSTNKLMELLCCNAPRLRKLCNRSYVSRLPQRMASLANLTHLDIRATSVKQEDLCILGAMPTLLYLMLTSKEAPGQRLTIRAQQFHCLKEFSFRSYGEGGLTMVTEQDAMPQLSRLHLEFREEESGSPEMDFEFNLEHLNRLKHIVVIIHCNGITKSMSRAGEAAIRHAASTISGHPTLEIRREFESYTVDEDD